MYLMGQTKFTIFRGPPMNIQLQLKQYALACLLCCVLIGVGALKAQPFEDQQAPLCHPNDCNFNGVFDDIETTPGEYSGFAEPGPYYVNDINQNRIPDECELDCNRNGYPDDYDVHGEPGAPDYVRPLSMDANQNNVPDECEVDCNRNGYPDDYDVHGEPGAPEYMRPLSMDANDNDIPDECEIDCNRNGYPDDYDVNGDPYAPDYVRPNSMDANQNSIPDECELDCNRNGYPDDYDINGPANGPDYLQPTSEDENENNIPDECERLEFTEPQFQKPYEITASSTYSSMDSYVATNVGDDNLSTFWAGGFGQAPYELSFRFEEEFYLTSVEVFVHNYFLPSSLELEVASGDAERRKAKFKSSGWIPVSGRAYMVKKELTFDKISGNRVYLRIPASTSSTNIVYEVRFVGISGFSDDCNFNEVKDSEEIATNLIQRENCRHGGYPECEGYIDIDLNDNNIVDSCEADCNKNYVPDSHEVAMNLIQRENCRHGGYPECEGFIDIDLNDNEIVDTCEADCNKNYVPDSHEVAMNLIQRENCRHGGYPECEGFVDIDLNDNEIVDACEDDCNKNYTPDSYEISMNLIQRENCRHGGYPECESFVDIDLNDNEKVDSCEEDCNRNFIPDDYEIAMDTYLAQYPEDQNCYYDSIRGYICESPRLVDANSDGIIDVCQFCPLVNELCSLEATSNSVYESYSRYQSQNLFDDNHGTLWVSNFSQGGAFEENTVIDISTGGPADIFYIELDWYHNYGAEFSIEVRTAGDENYRPVYSGAEWGSSEASSTTSVVALEEPQVTDIRLIILRPASYLAVLSEMRIVGLSENACGNRASGF